jgi:hippurate hydrolase
MHWRTLTISALLAIAGTIIALPGQAPVATSWVEARLDRLEAFYRELHENPELSFQEKQTAERLASALRTAGLEVTTGVGGHGVVGVLANGAGPTVMFRADLDGLPIAEATGLPFASKIRAEAQGGQAIGVMHACGHDLHMTNLVGTAQWFAENKNAWRGTIVCIGQPAEERAGGAKATKKPRRERRQAKRQESKGRKLLRRG